MRRSVDGTKTFVKYEVTEVTASYVEVYPDTETDEMVETTIEAGVYGRPSIYSEDYPEYTHSEMLTILAGKEWTTPLNEEV